jgi:SAM-dependent methyltransferase
MTEVFGAYSRYYDLLYADKQYQQEADYVASKLSAAGVRSGRILELGCGTGAHAEFIARRGYSIHGVDLSPGMIERAEDRRRSLAPELGSQLSFGCGDVRHLRQGHCFDAVISLFHVMSYQATNADLAAAFDTAALHLQPGGLFLFDFWYGPAVLTQQPAVRIKRLADRSTSVLRIAEPRLDENANCVDVQFTVQIEDIATSRREDIVETHRMRYFFLPELDMFLRGGGFERVAAVEWMSDREPSRDTWGVLAIARKIAR